MTTEPNAYRPHFAYEIARWRTSLTPKDALVNADAAIAVLEAGGVPPDTRPVGEHHPLIHWIAERFEVHWPLAAAAYAATI